MPDKEADAQAKTPSPAPAIKSDAPADDDARTPAPLPDDPLTAAVVDREIFDQILELDDEGTFEFSKEIVSAYFSQADTTFDSMDRALEEEKLKELSELGHFLKSSSSALGICDVQASCEKIEQYGDLRGDDAATPISSADALARIRELLPAVKADHATAERWLRKFYADKNAPFADDPPAPPTIPKT